MIERHITLDRSMYGSDQSASLERKGICEISESYESISRAMMAHPLTVVDPTELAVAAKMRYWED